jgi:hypothetical protein
LTESVFLKKSIDFIGISYALQSQFTLTFHSLIVILNEFVECHRISREQLREAEVPLIDVHGLVVAQRRSFDEILAILLS